VFPFESLIKVYREDPSANADTPRKRRKVEHALNVSEASWVAFERDVGEFEVQHVQAQGKFAFGFVEGPLVKALRSGDWYVFENFNANVVVNFTSPLGFFSMKSISRVPRPWNAYPRFSITLLHPLH
jgi:hypothetical protein